MRAILVFIPQSLKASEQRFLRLSIRTAKLTNLDNFNRSLFSRSGFRNLLRCGKQSAENLSSLLSISEQKVSRSSLASSEPSDVGKLIYLTV